MRDKIRDSSRSHAFLAVAIVAIVNSSALVNYPVTRWGALMLLVIGISWAGQVRGVRGVPSVLALGAVTLLFSLMISGGPGVVAGALTLLGLSVAGIATGAWLHSSRAAGACASIIIAIIQWPLVIAQWREPLRIYERLNLESSGLASSQIIAAAHGLRPIGTLVSPGLLAVMLLFGLSLSLRAITNTNWRVLSVVTAAGHGAALLATGSRAGLATACLLLLFAFGKRRLSTVAALVALFAFAGGRQIERVGIESRLEILRSALTQLDNNWLFGVGWGQTPQLVSTVTDGRIYHLHFLPAHILFELGIVGLIGSVLIVGWLVIDQPKALIIVAPFLLLDVGVLLEPRTAVIFWSLIALLRCHVKTTVSIDDRLESPFEAQPRALGSPGISPLRAGDV